MAYPTTPPPGSGPPHVIEVSGTSMAPGIPRGARVVVRPLAREPVPGDVVLFETPSGRLLHRVVGLGTWRGGRELFHCGDGARTIGVTASHAAVGLAVAVLHPPGCAVPRPHDLDDASRRRFHKARRRVRAVVLGAYIAERLGWLRRPLRGPGLLLRRRILGA